MSVNTADVERMVDRASVREVVEAYMSATDRWDFAAIAACFTPDAHLEYDGVEQHQFTGGQEVAEWMSHFGHTTTHTVSSCHIVLSGDQAHTDTFGVAVIILGEGGPGSVLVAGVRYVDTLVRTEAGWLITKRKHTITWQFSASRETISVGRKS
jgi:ketosteroid isomerase-like protein